MVPNSNPVATKYSKISYAHTKLLIKQFWPRVPPFKCFFQNTKKKLQSMEKGFNGYLLKSIGFLISVRAKECWNKMGQKY